MNKTELILQVESIKNAKRTYREQAAKFVLENPHLFSNLLELVFENNSKINIKASWAFELACLENITILFPHVQYFSSHLNVLDHESMIRPISKICSLLVSTYKTDNPDKINFQLSHENKTQILEANFDWLIGDHKIAAQVHAMDTLYLLGLEFEWIHEELKLILEQNIMNGSPGYQVRAKRTLLKLQD